MWDSNQLLGLALLDQGPPGQGNDFVAIVAYSKQTMGTSQRYTYICKPI